MKITAIQGCIVKRQTGYSAFLKVNDKTLKKTSTYSKVLLGAGFYFEQVSFVQIVCLILNWHSLNVHMTSQRKRANV